MDSEDILHCPFPPSCPSPACQLCLGCLEPWTSTPAPLPPPGRRSSFLILAKKRLFLDPYFFDASMEHVGHNASSPTLAGTSTKPDKAGLSSLLGQKIMRYTKVPWIPSIFKPVAPRRLPAPRSPLHGAGAVAAVWFK